MGRIKELAYQDCRRERRTQGHQARRDLALRDLRDLGRQDRRDQLLSARDAVGRKGCVRVAPDAEILRGTAPAALDADDLQGSASAKPRSGSGVLGRTLSGLPLGTQDG